MKPIVRYRVEWLDYPLAVSLMTQRGSTDPEMDSVWDFVSEDDVQKARAFKTKATAFAWAKRNASADMFNMPRIREETFGPAYDDLGNHEGEAWEETGYWELSDGAVVEIRT